MTNNMEDGIPDRLMKRNVRETMFRITRSPKSKRNEAGFRAVYRQLRITTKSLRNMLSKKGTGGILDYRRLSQMHYIYKYAPVVGGCLMTLLLSRCGSLPYCLLIRRKNIPKRMLDCALDCVAASGRVLLIW